jgi:hypothetical protein
MSTNNKRDMEASENNDEFEEDYKDGSSLHDGLLRKMGCFVKSALRMKDL